MTSSDARKDFFVSYTGADERWACWVAYELEEAGYSVVIQKWDFRPGSDFVAEMDGALTLCNRTIAILSADYLAATFTNPEWRAAFAKDPDGASRKLIPVRIEDVSPQGLLSTRIWIDLAGLEEHLARERLLEGVRDGRAKPDVRPPFPGGSNHTVAKPERFPGGGIDRSDEATPTPLEEDDVVVLTGLFEFQTRPGDPRKGRHSLNGDELRQVTGLDPNRINDAVEILKGERLVEILDALGTAPYEFQGVQLTALGRRRVSARLKQAESKSPPAVAEEWIPHEFIERSGVLAAISEQGYRVVFPLQHEVASRKLDGWEEAIVEYEGCPTKFKIHSGDPQDPHVMMKKVRRELTQEEADDVARKHFGAGGHVRSVDGGFEVRRLDTMPGLPVGIPPSMRTSVLGRGPTRNRALLSAGAALPEDA